MQIVYCETCGKRIPPADLENKSAIFIDENQALCAICTPARAATQAAAAAVAQAVTQTETEAAPPVRNPTGTNVRPPTARLDTRGNARRSTTVLKKGAGSSGGLSSVKEAPKQLPIPAFAAGGVAVLCVAAYFVFGSSSKDNRVASVNATSSVATGGEVALRKAAPAESTPAPAKASVPVAGPQPADPVEASPRRQLAEEARPLPEPPSQQRSSASPEIAAAKPENLMKAAPDAIPRDAAKSAEPPPASSLDKLLERKDEKSTAPANDTPVPASTPPGAPPSPPLPLPLNDDTPDDPFNRDKTLSRKIAPPPANPGNDLGGAAKPAAAAAAKPRPAFVRGKACDLFPADLSSHSDEIVDPRNASKTAKIDRFDGWIYTCPELVGMNVKDGVLSLTKQGLMQLDRFPCTEYKLSFEVQLGANSALAVQTGANVAVSNLLIITESHFMPGTWDVALAANNVRGDDKLAKPHGTAKGAWIPVQLLVHPDSVDCAIGSKPAVKLPLPRNASLAQLGFMSMGLNNNATPSFKIRKASLYAP